jgi:hypothetical protein
MRTDYYRWLECEVEPGMWETERTVHFRVDLDGHRGDADLWVDQGLVRTRDDVMQGRRVSGRFRVCLVKQEGRLAVVLLPVQSARYGSCVAVPADRLAVN